VPARGERRGSLVRLFLGCVVIASAWVWWVDANKKEPLVRHQGGVTALVRSSEVPRGGIIRGVLVVADTGCMSIDMSGTVSPVIWPFDSDLVYDGQGVSSSRMLPRPARDPSRVDARVVEVGETLTATGTVLTAGRAREVFPDLPDGCLTGASVVVLDSLEGAAEPLGP